MIDHILLGHNPLFGVNHLSAERGAAVAERFEDAQAIRQLLLGCHELGIRGMMMSTHPRSSVVAEVIGSEPKLRADWRLYPLVPYIQKYVREANEKGLLNVVRDQLAQATWAEKLAFALRGGVGLIGKDVPQALKLLVDVELMPFKGRPLGAIFLHDTLTDLALGLGVEAVLEVFIEHVREKYRAVPALTTKNLPLLCERLKRRGLSDLVVMASFNAAGFYMNPSAEACVAAAGTPGLNLLAMNTLASGALKPEEAYRFLGQFPAIKSVVVGTSRVEHAAEAVTVIRRYLPSLS